MLSLLLHQLLRKSPQLLLQFHVLCQRIGVHFVCDLDEELATEIHALNFGAGRTIKTAQRPFLFTDRHGHRNHAQYIGLESPQGLVEALGHLAVNNSWMNNIAVDALVGQATGQSLRKQYIGELGTSVAAKAYRKRGQKTKLVHRIMHA